MAKALILAPHQDDELILCGSFLKELTEEKEVYVVFTTNGNYDESVHTIRLEEALKVCSLYGICEENVIFLGYANEYDTNCPHIYNAGDGEIVTSQYGISETYGLLAHPEYCFSRKGVHHSYTRGNIKQDLCDVISEIMPDVIFATDIEIHPDHKCNSLLLDEVIGEILKSNIDYTPIILKKPGYSTSWFAVNDYAEINNSSVKFKYGDVRTNGHRSQFYNPYFKWSNRIRIPIGKSVRTANKEENILYNALSLYKSQNAVKHFEAMQNNDVVFWQRRTDSLTYRAQIVASSGNAAFLNDFKVVDTSSVARTKFESWEADASIWRPDISDLVRRVDFYLEDVSPISEILIYQEYYPKSVIVDSHVVLDDRQFIGVGPLKVDDVTKVRFEPYYAKKISFFIDKVSDNSSEPGIAEIEIFKSQSPRLVYSKLMIKDDFVYEYHVRPNERVRLQVYECWSNGLVKTVSLDAYSVKLIPQYNGAEVVFDEDRITGAIEGDIAVEITHKMFTNITDKIYVKPYGIMDKNESGLYKILKKRAVQFLKKHIWDDCGIYHGSIADCIASFSYGEYRKGMGAYVKDYIRGYICDSNKRIQRNDKKVFFIGTPDHGNLGDHAITIATYNMLRRTLGNFPIEEVTIKQFARKFSYLKTEIKPRDLIVLQGGGNMGNIYWRNERIRREIISHFPNNTKLIFPETIYYEKSDQGRADFELSKRIYRNNNLVVFAREKESYNIMMEAYPDCSVELVPDIVCSMISNGGVCIRHKVGLCFRNDIEKGINSLYEEKIIDELRNRHEEYTRLDMMYVSHGYIGKANRKRIVQNKINEISSFKYVITDRLHGMILCYITGTPCVVISNYNHKIRSYYDTWFKDVDYIRFVADPSEIGDSIQAVSACVCVKPEPLRFDSMVRLLEEWEKC